MQTNSKKTIQIPLMGGLGNQLFQLAAGLYVHQKYGRDICYPTTLLQPPKLLRSRNTSRRDLMISNLLNSNERKRLSKLQLFLFKLITHSKRKYVVYESSCNTELLDSYDSTTRIFIGYFQQIRYVDSIGAELLERFRTSPTFNSLIPKSLEPRIAIHIRLGDYSSNQHARSFHGLSDISYFVEGAKILLKRLQIKDILIVSDEPKRAQSLFEQFFDLHDVQISCSNGTNEYEDLALLSHSAGLVASNSSFSWWAAWLSSPLGSQVIVPSPWFAKKSKAEENLFDSRWTVLERRISISNQQHQL